MNRTDVIDSGNVFIIVSNWKIFIMKENYWFKGGINLWRWSIWEVLLYLILLFPYRMMGQTVAWNYFKSKVCFNDITGLELMKCYNLVLANLELHLAPSDTVQCSMISSLYRMESSVLIAELHWTPNGTNQSLSGNVPLITQLVSIF